MTVSQPTLYAVFGAKPAQIRTCLIHIIYNVCAAVLIFAVVLIGHGTGLISEHLLECYLNSGGVANIHGAFRLIPAVCLLPFSGAFAKLAERIVPDAPVDDEDAEIEKNLRELDVRLVENPNFALTESRHLIKNMSEVCFKKLLLSSESDHSI